MQISRRQFVHGVAASSSVMALNGTAPSFLVDAAERLDACERVLVIIQLSGGNDGLNTIIPYRDESYYSARPTLAIPREEVVPINDELGFHPALRPLADLLENAELAVVQGVGYPRPNRSHFESMDIWHTCQRRGARRDTGWLGRFLEAAPTDRLGGDAAAVHLGAKKQPLALAARNIQVPSIRSLERFRLNDGGDQRLREVIDELTATARGRQDNLLGFIQGSTAAALAASRRVEDVGQRYKPAVPYPDNQLAQRLRTAAQLIDAGLETRIYYTEIDGFDTHSQQAAAHAALLRQLGSAMSAFIEDVKQHGHGDRVLVFSFSEFGRRVKENASEGTDHGAALPLLLAGSPVKAGLIGNQPSLTELEDGDLRFHTDFRQVYAAILEDWLGCPSQEVLGAAYSPVDVIAERPV